MLLLRAFLAVTFTYAALQKLANRFFFDAANPGSIQSQLKRHFGQPDRNPPAAGGPRPGSHRAVDRLGELAVGLGTLVGLFGRLAAGGGMVLSLILFLTVSFNTTPYFYGSEHRLFLRLDPLCHRRERGVVARRRPGQAPRTRARLGGTRGAARAEPGLDRRAALGKVGPP